MAQGHLARKSSARKNFQTGFVVPGGGFLSYWNNQLIKFKEEKRFGKFSLPIFSLQDIPVPLSIIKQGLLYNNRIVSKEVKTKISSKSPMFSISLLNRVTCHVVTKVWCFLIDESFWSRGHQNLLFPYWPGLHLFRGHQSLMFPYCPGLLVPRSPKFNVPLLTKVTKVICPFVTKVTVSLFTIEWDYL